MRLFIIGNGFDVDHGLATRFKDFRSFLEQSYVPSFNRQCACFPFVGIDEDGDIVVDPNTGAQNLYALVSQASNESDWSDFEESLGKINYQEVFDLIEEDEENPFRYQRNLEDLISDFRTSKFASVSPLFSEWIGGIDLTGVRKKYHFQPDDLFITFNFTMVLEEVYGISKERICHIHGSSEKKFCILGHGNNEDLMGEYDESVSFELNQIHKALRKPVETIYEQNLPFFQRIYDSPITEIVFFGHSFSEIDSYYFKRLFENLNTNGIGGYLSEYEDKNEKGRMEIIKALGFNGDYTGAFD